MAVQKQSLDRTGRDLPILGFAVLGLFVLPLEAAMAPSIDWWTKVPLAVCYGFYGLRAWSRKAG